MESKDCITINNIASFFQTQYGIDIDNEQPDYNPVETIWTNTFDNKKRSIINLPQEVARVEARKITFRSCLQFFQAILKAPETNLTMTQKENLHKLYDKTFQFLQKKIIPGCDYDMPALALYRFKRQIRHAIYDNPNCGAPEFNNSQYIPIKTIWRDILDSKIRSINSISKKSERSVAIFQAKGVAGRFCLQFFQEILATPEANLTAKQKENLHKLCDDTFQFLKRKIDTRGNYVANIFKIYHLKKQTRQAVREDPILRGIEHNAEKENTLEQKTQERNISTSEVSEICRLGDMDRFEELIDSDVDLNKPITPKGLTPFFLAIKSKNVAFIRKLLETGKVNVNQVNKYGQTPFYIACRKGLNDIGALLIEKTLDLNPRTSSEFSLLMQAVLFHNNFLVLKLLETGKVNVDYVERNGRSALYLAGREGLNDLAVLFIKNLTDLNGPSESIYTPLMQAVSSHNIFLVQKLLETGKVDINHGSQYGRTALHEACFDNQSDIAALLIEHNANPNTQTQRGHTPLMSAVSSGNITLVQKLLETGKVNVNIADIDGSQAISHARNPTIYKMLRDYGADPFETNSDEGIKNILSGFCNIQSSWGRNSRPMDPLDVLFMHAVICNKFAEEAVTDKDLVQKISYAYEQSRINSLENVLNSIKTGNDPVFIHGGWDGHSVFIGFFGDYLCIINKGENLTNEKKVQVYHFDRQKLDLNDLKSLCDDIDVFDTKAPFLYRDLMQKIDAQEDAVSQRIMNFIRKRNCFPLQTRGNCSVANCKPLIFFAKVFEKGPPSESHDFEGSFKFFKSVTGFTRKFIKDKYRKTLAKLTIDSSRVNK